VATVARLAGRQRRDDRRGPDRIRRGHSEPAAGVLQRVAVTLPLATIAAIAARLAGSQGRPGCELSP